VLEEPLTEAADFGLCAAPEAGDDVDHSECLGRCQPRKRPTAVRVG
jgi:hypothetical protein